VSSKHSPTPTTPPGSDRSTDLALLLMTVIWGVNFAIVKGAMAWIPPLGFNALRFPIAAVAVYGVLRWKGPIPLPERRHLPLVFLLGLLGNGIYQIFFVVGLDWTRAGNTSLLLATTPAWTVLLSAWTGEGTLTLKGLLGVGLTLAGVGLLVLGSGSEVGLGTGTALWGDLMVLSAALLWAIYTVGSRGLILRYGSLPVTAWTLWVGTVILMLIGIPDLVRLSWASVPLVTGWGAVFFAGAFAVALSYVIWYHGVQRLGSTRTATFSNAVPVVALLTAWVVLDEVPTALQWLGAAIVLAGVVLTRFAGSTPGTQRGSPRSP
jgi:drug/metabolite transporter (DMT)-like permease